jgi:hypothetical protein
LDRAGRGLPATRRLFALRGARNRFGVIDPADGGRVGVADTVQQP